MYEEHKTSRINLCFNSRLLFWYDLNMSCLLYLVISIIINFYRLLIYFIYIEKLLFLFDFFNFYFVFKLL